VSRVNTLVRDADPDTATNAERHLRAPRVPPVLICGAIVGLGLIVALEPEEPEAVVMAGTLVGTGIAIGLTELYSEFLGTEAAARRRVDRAGRR
jgi:hypothetical protein